MFIAIVKRVKDLKDKGAYKDFPPEYPVDCVELKTEGEVDAFLAGNPGAEVLTVEQYRGMQAGLAMLFNHLQAPRPGFFKRVFGK